MLYLEARIDDRVERWPLRGRRFTVGRAGDCDIRVGAESISRRHLTIEITDESILVEDLESTNGMWVDGRRTPRARIDTDEWFVAGAVMFCVREGLWISSSSGERRASSAQKRMRTLNAVTEVTSARRAAGETATPRIPGWSRVLASAFERDHTPEDALRALLAEVSGALDARGVSLLSWREGSMVTEATCGEAPPAELDALDGDVLGREGAACVELARGGHAVALTVDDARCLVIHPADAATSPDENLSTVLHVVRWLSRRISSDDRSRPLATPRALAVDASAGDFFIHVSESMRTVIHEVDRLASTSLSVLIVGESGTGKELLARRLHRRSARARGPFVAINCAALPAELLDSEMFGIDEGVATGVRGRKGRFELAEGGTLFLDEIAELPSDLQPKLLRALESGEITPLGAAASRHIDVRVVGATNKSWHELQHSDAFRTDLLFRIAGAHIEVPPLRARPEEILPLATAFARRAAKSLGRPFAALDVRAARALLDSEWRGNVRELRNVIERAVALADDAVLHVDLLPAAMRDARASDRSGVLLALDEDWRTARDRFARFYFESLLERYDGNVTEAAKASGLARSNFYAHLKRLGIVPR